MKIKHWRQVKDFSQDEIDDLLGELCFKYVHLACDAHDWHVVEISACFRGGKASKEYSECYIKDIEKPTLPYVFNHG